jgi:hypothetical protein
MQITPKTNTNKNNDLASRFDKLKRICSNTFIDKPNTTCHRASLVLSSGKPMG